MKMITKDVYVNIEKLNFMKKHLSIKNYGIEINFNENVTVVYTPSFLNEMGWYSGQNIQNCLFHYIQETFLLKLDDPKFKIYPDKIIKILQEIFNGVEKDLRECIGYSDKDKVKALQVEGKKCGIWFDISDEDGLTFSYIPLPEVKPV